MRSQYDADRGDIDACTDLDRDQPYFSVERNEDDADDDKDDDADLEGVREVACPYSEVDETDLAVSAGKYGTGTVLIPPFREYLALHWHNWHNSNFYFLSKYVMCVKCVCASDRHGRKGLGLEAVVGPRSGGLVDQAGSSGHLGT